MRSNLLLLNFFLIINVFAIQNVDFISDEDEFFSQQILEVRKISTNGIGERRRIYFYKNGEIKDIYFDDSNKINVEYFKITKDEDIDFLNNISLEAINSIKNDKIEFIQNYKNIDFNFQNNNFFDIDSYQSNGNYGKRLQEVLFNNKKLYFNNIQMIKNKNLLILENNRYFYEIRYKNKIFMISNFPNDYENGEIKKLIEIISMPFYIIYKKNDSHKVDKIKTKSNIQIEKIKFLDKIHYEYKKYTFYDDKKMIETMFKLNAINQLEIKEKKYKLENKLNDYFHFELFGMLKKLSKNNIEYSYKINSLEGLNYKIDEKNPLLVTYNNKVFENPTIYKIYYNSVNPYIFIEEDKNNKDIINILKNINSLEKSNYLDEVKRPKVMLSQNKSKYFNYKSDVIIDSELKDIDNYFKDPELREINFKIIDNIFNPEKKVDFCKLPKYHPLNHINLLTVKDFRFILSMDSLEYTKEIVEMLEKNWKYKNIGLKLKNIIKEEEEMKKIYENCKNEI